ncbi:MAG: DUF4199 domain-containing protein [Bacteroidales bacterium]|nr:DUF4199 domain-containing protein [Bacteroidales bacterium]
MAGVWTGLVLALYLVARWLLNKPVDAPQGFGSDIAVLAAMLFFSVRYRRTLPEKKVTLKELMQHNIWTGFVAALLFGISLWLYGTSVDGDLLNRCVARMIEFEQQDGNDRAETIATLEAYTLFTISWIGAFRTFVMSILWAFIAALLFQTEKAPVKEKK